MKENFKKQLRLQFIAGLAVLAFILITCGHEDGEVWTWFVIAKCAAVVLGAGAYALGKRWKSKGLLPEISEC